MGFLDSGLGTRVLVIECERELLNRIVSFILSHARFLRQYIMLIKYSYQRGL